MLLVVDANVVIAALIARGKTLDLICDQRIELIAPELIQIETRFYEGEILKKSGLSSTELNTVLDAVFRRIRIIPKLEYLSFKEKAMRATPDLNDWQYFALALKENCSVWSNDKALKRQPIVSILSTHDLVKRIQ